MPSKYHGGDHERSRHFRNVSMVSLAQPVAVESAYRREPRLDVRWFRSVRTYSHRGRCAPSTLGPFRICAHPRLCRRGHCDNRIRLGDRRPARRRACRLSRPQALDDPYDPRLFAAHGRERVLLGLAVVCRVSLSRWARDRLGMGDGASIMAELWPAKARGKGGAFLQSGYPIGSILASGVWLAIGTSGPDAWRYMYL